jgi:predicted acyltransferase
MPTSRPVSALPQRLLSLDLMRGIIMVLLCLESTGMYYHLSKAAEGGPFEALMIQFDHHPWNGLRFWDLIQPGFMFIAGVALAFSLDKQNKAGVPWTSSFRKALKRSGWLFFWGVLDYAVRPGGLSFELWDVLTQLSFTSLVAFLVFKWELRTQAIFCIGLLLLTEALYRFTHVPGFDQPFTDQHNFGNYVDTILMNKINKGGWVAINCIPTAVHTVAGAMAGKLLLGNSGKKTRTLLIAAAACLLVGFSLDWSGITPIIKRIATSSFTLASLGWCLLGLAACYWWVDIQGHRKHLTFFTTMGMNALFIYLFFEIVGARWFNDYVRAFTDGLSAPLGLTTIMQGILGSAVIFALEWGMCRFLYTKRIFFKV